MGTAAIGGVGPKRLIFGANWKAAMPPEKTRKFLREFLPRVLENSYELGQTKTQIVIGAPSACLSIARQGIKESAVDDLVGLAVQDPWHVSRAYTGATTFEMVRDPEIDAGYAIIGHSEAREPWRIITEVLRLVVPEFTGVIVPAINARLQLGTGESAASRPAAFRLANDLVVAAEVRKCLEVKMVPIVCVGETQQERNAGQTVIVVLGQLNAALKGLTPMQIAQTIIAYEPVWEIGTGVTATFEQAQDVHAEIRRELIRIALQGAPNIPIIYGGNMNPGNVAELVSQTDIDGGLIGEASLDPAVFMELILNGVRATSV